MKSNRVLIFLSLLLGVIPFLFTAMAEEINTMKRIKAANTEVKVPASGAGGSTIKEKKTFGFSSHGRAGVSKGGAYGSWDHSGGYKGLFHGGGFSGRGYTGWSHGGGGYAGWDHSGGVSKGFGGGGGGRSQSYRKAKVHVDEAKAAETKNGKNN